MRRPKNKPGTAGFFYVLPDAPLLFAQQLHRRDLSDKLHHDSRGEHRLDHGHQVPLHREVRERLETVARFYGQKIGVKYGEPFVVKETMRVDDVMGLGVRSL